MTTKEYIRMAMGSPIQGYPDYETGSEAQSERKMNWLRAGKKLCKQLAKELGLAEGRLCEERINRMKAKDTMNVTLKDAWSSPFPSHNVKVEAFNHSILISPEGYSEKTAVDSGGSPILIEFAEGKLRVVVWGDINSEEPTHTIDMEAAKESNRQ
jgi:hypothetical protein